MAIKVTFEKKPISCPSCASNNIKNKGIIPDSNIFAGIRISETISGGTLFECTICKLNFKHPYLDKNTVSDYYAKADLGTWSNHDKIRTDWLIIKKFLSGWNGNIESVLDIGCGVGDFLEFLDAGWNKYGIEINKEAAEAAKAKNINIIATNFYSDLQFYNQKFDVVVALDVIEHALDPKLLLESMHEVTRKNGLLIVATGNTEAISWRIMRSRYWYCALLEHVSFINPTWCKLIAQSYNLKIMQILYYSHLGTCSIVYKFKETCVNMLYKIAPSVAARLRKSGFGKIKTSDPRMSLYPPSFASAKDHFIVIFQREK